MNTEDEQFLNLKTFPARVRVEEAALLLGFSIREMPILAAAGLLKPLGHPPITGVKYYAVKAIEELRRDEKWLARASDYIVAYWQNMNAKRKESGKKVENQNRSRFPENFKRKAGFARIQGPSSEYAPTQ